MGDSFNVRELSLFAFFYSIAFSFNVSDSFWRICAIVSFFGGELMGFLLLPTTCDQVGSAGKSVWLLIECGGIDAPDVFLGIVTTEDLCICLSLWV